MSRLNNNLITLFLVIVLISNIFIFLFPGPQKAEASFINEYKDGIFTAVKGLAMLWILNLIIQKGGDSETEEDNIITSLINGESEESEESKENEESEDREDRENAEGPEKGNKKQEAENSGVEIVPSEENQIKDKVKSFLNEDEQKLWEQVNEIRAENDVSPLEVDHRLVEVARIKAEDMIDNDYFEHQSPVYGSPFEMMEAKEINYLLAGENLAGAPTVEEALEVLMDSPEHRENILDERYNKAGFAVIEGGPYGLMVVQHFIKTE